MVTEDAPGIPAQTDAQLAQERAQRLTETGLWLQTHKYWPSAAAAHEEERALGRWLAQHAPGTPTLPLRERIILAALVRGTTPQPRPTWTTQLDAYAEWVHTHGRLPRHNETDETESGWHAWQDRTRVALTPSKQHEIELRAPFLLDPTLTPARAHLAPPARTPRDQTVTPAPTPRNRDVQWQSMLNQYLVWTDIHYRKPRADATDQIEHKLYSWFHRQRANNLTPERARILDEFLPLRNGRRRVDLIHKKEKPSTT